MVCVGVYFKKLDLIKGGIMEPTYNKVYSPDDNGYYCEFWDKITGKDIIAPNGETLTTGIHSNSHRANKIAKRVIRSIHENKKFCMALQKVN